MHVSKYLRSASTIKKTTFWKGATSDIAPSSTKAALLDEGGMGRKSPAANTIADTRMKAFERRRSVVWKFHPIVPESLPYVNSRD